MKKIVSIVTVCALTLTMGAFSVFAAAPSTSALYVVQKNTTLYTGSDNNTLVLSCEVYSMRPYTITASEDGTTSNTFTVAQQVIINYRFVNSSTDSVYINAAYCDLFPIWTYQDGGSNLDTVGVEIDTIEGNLFQGFGMLQGSATFRFRWGDQYSYNGRAVIPAKSIVSHCISVTYYYNYNDIQNTLYDPDALSRNYISDFTIANPKAENCSKITNYDLYNVNYNSAEIAEAVNGILEAYTYNYTNTGSTNTAADSIENNVSTVHTAETNWFNQNLQALNYSGIQNYSLPYSNTDRNLVLSWFSQLWNSIGSYNTVFTFSMMISLVMLILRHNPQRRKQTANTRSGGKSNGSSS